MSASHFETTDPRINYEALSRIEEDEDEQMEEGDYFKFKKVKSIIKSSKRKQSYNIDCTSSNTSMSNNGQSSSSKRDKLKKTLRVKRKATDDTQISS